MKRGLQQIGWALCVLVPAAMSIVFANWENWRTSLGVDFLSGWQLIVGGVVGIAILGHSIVVRFWCSLQKHNVEKVASGSKSTDSDCRVGATDMKAVIGLQRFLSRKFGEDFRIETDYRFPNGLRGDVVVVRGRGRYPIMCFEVAPENRVNEAAEQLKLIAGPFVNSTRCFVITRTKDRGFQK